MIVWQSILFLGVVCFLSSTIQQASAWSLTGSKDRRAFLRNAVSSSTAAVVTLSTASGVTNTMAASAYERRDVGGTERSPEQAAYNEQAYETNNRLEKAGLKLETREEQSKALTAALGEYSYSSTTPSSKDKKKKKN